MRIYLQANFDIDKPPRYYQLMLQEDLLEGWTLIREWGILGSPGRIKRDHFANREQAQQAMLLVRDAQLKRGFSVVFMQGIESI
ncbi:MAG: WGR domain-containing protein [Gammaproteobacteria bacterium]|nr:WGR domain-containing protein [Gammaproteobacteria bacterium]